MNCTSDGQFKIQVNDSGELIALYSSITNGTQDYNYDFYFLPDSKGIISRSTISHCGYSGGGSEGLRIESSNVTIYQNTIETSYNGLNILNSTPIIISNKIRYSN